MKKLNYIFCKNFKAFYGNDADESTNKIVLDGKNLLLYGENGSGKSSLYWALYTFLQSALKNDDAEVTKYFDPNDDENLRNRYCQDTDGSAIELSFEGDDSNPERIIEISEKYSKSTDNTFVEKTLQNSDFFNYKFLFKLYDFAAGEKIDLFPLFRKEMFPFIQLRSGNASDGWEKIMSLINELPVGIQKKIIYDKKNKIDHYEPEQLQNLVYYKNIFNENLDRIIQDIAAKAKGYLQKLGYNFSLILDFKGFEYNVVNGTVFVEKEKYTVPQIILRIKENTFPYNKQIDKPHIFLNEAKLSAVALSIRLSLLDTRGSDDKAGRILVVDDLLISLDMSNRDVVLDILLDKANQYQIIMMTHDRAFYNIIKNRIDNYKTTKDWVFKEMYQYVSKNIPEPKIINTKDYLDLAYKYLKACDFPASANYMRKECERILGEILPKDKAVYLPEIPDLKGQVDTVDAGGEKVYQLQNLIDNFIGFCLETGINVSEYQKILEFKDMLLNPLSHNDFKKPIYRGELEKCYNILLKLNELNAQIEKKTIGDNGDKFNLRFSDGSTEYVYTFHLKNEFYKYKLNGQNIWRNEPFGSMSWEEDNKVQYIGENLADPANPVIPCYDLKDFINFLMKTHFPKHKHISIKNMSGDWTNIWDVAYIINDDGSETLLKDL